MSMFENDQYCWRETYFVLFDARKRPKLEVVRKALARLNSHFTLTNLNGNDQGLVESLTILAPDDFAALDICYVDGDEVVEHRNELLKDLDEGEGTPEERAKRQRLKHCNGRFDVLHFEQVVDFDEEEEADGLLDPTALLVVLETLVKLTDGVAFDPQAGAIL
jgi:hypothetical protein